MSDETWREELAHKLAQRVSGVTDEAQITSITEAILEAMKAERDNSVARSRALGPWPPTKRV